MLPECLGRPHGVSHDTDLTVVVKPVASQMCRLEQPGKLPPSTIQSGGRRAERRTG
jgi:hypothetical protein